MESNIVSGILAQALVTLPKITAAELYAKCEGQIGTTSLAQFRVELAEWLKDGTIPGYESRKGPTGGIYRKGSATVKMAGAEKTGVQLDPAPIAAFIEELLKTQPRVTVSDLMTKIDIAPLTEAQFRQQMSAWLNDGKTFPLFESRKGPTGGIYPIGSESEKWIPNHDDNDPDSVDEHSNGFAVQVSPTVKILQSDSRNWVIQKLSGNTWVNQGYHPDIVGCINSAVRHAVNSEFGLANSLVQLKDLAKVFKQMEARLTGHLQQNVQAQVQA